MAVPRARPGPGHRVQLPLRAAIDSLQQSFAVRSELGLAAAESSSLGSLGRAYHHLGALQKARVCYQRSVDLLAEGRHPLSQALGYFYLGAVERDLGRPDTAVRHLNQALELSRVHRFRQCTAMALSYMALVNAESGQSATARHHLAAAQQELHGTGDKRVESECLSTVAEALLRLGDTRSALDHSRRGLTTARAARYRQGEARALIEILSSLVALGENTAEQELLRTQASRIINESGYQLLDERLRARGLASDGSLLTIPTLGLGRLAEAALAPAAHSTIPQR
jgi:tetratricopeptide (TPR) repeat protein